jgi:flagellar motor component MotA
MKPIQFFGLCLSIGIILGALVIVGVPLLAYVDVPSLIVVMGISLGLGLASKGAKVFKAYGTAVHGGTEEQIRDALGSFRLLSRGLIASSFLSVLLGIIALLSFSVDATGFSRGLGVVLIGPLYGLVLYMFGILPFLGRLESLKR